ncbi:MAG: N-glycosylase/DNA lyase [Desulfurococcaceae archaeon]
MIYIDMERALTIARLFDKIRDIIPQLEIRDPQYLALKKLISKRGCDEAALLTICNSLVSYQLLIPGEEYWSLFADYFSRMPSTNLIEDLLEFMKANNHRFLTNKINRVKRFLYSNLAHRLRDNGLGFCENPCSLYKDLLVELKADKYSKTIAFAIKMYTYLCDICGVKVNSFLDIPLPLDRRNVLFSITSCLVKGCNSVATCTSILYKENKLKEMLLKTWNNICRLSGIPCIKIDVFTWLFTGVLEKVRFDANKVIQVFREKYEVEIPFEVVYEFSRCGGLHECTRNTGKYR